VIKKLGKKEQIYELLKDNRLTIKEIVGKMDFSGKYPINQTRMYIYRLIDENKVKELPKDGREILYIAIKKESMNEIDKFRDGFNQYHILFKKLTKTDITEENLKILAKKILDFDLIKHLEKEMIN